MPRTFQFSLRVRDNRRVRRQFQSSPGRRPAAPSCGPSGGPTKAGGGLLDIVLAGGLECAAAVRADIRQGGSSGGVRSDRPETSGLIVAPAIAPADAIAGPFQYELDPVPRYTALVPRRACGGTASGLAWGMARTINQATLLEHLCGDAEFRHLPSGEAVASLRLATSRSYRRDDGEWAEEPSGTTSSRGRRPGSRSTGRLRTRSWEDRGGHKRRRTEVAGFAVDVILLAPAAGGAAITTFPTRSDPGLVAAAPVLVAVCVVVTGIIVHAGALAWRPCVEACGEADR